MERNPDYKLILDSGMAHKGLKESWWKWKHAPIRSIVLTNEDNEPRAILRLFPRALSYIKKRGLGPKKLYQAIGIGGVFVPSDFRGLGLGSELLNRTMNLFRVRQETEYVILYSKDRTIYERCGFVKVQEIKDQWLMVAPVRGPEVVEGHWSVYPGDKF